MYFLYKFKNMYLALYNHKIYHHIASPVQVTTDISVSYKQPLPSFVGTLAKRSQGLRV